jgi:hypothetical protein
VALRARVLVSWILITGILAVPLSVILWNYIDAGRRISRLTESRNVVASEGKLSQVAGATVNRIRVWGAGMRTSSGSFCGCAMVPKPERVYYESTDPQEIRGLIALIRPRPYLDLGIETANCGQITIDFMNDDHLLGWIHLKGQNFRSSEGVIPVTSGSVAALNEWIKRHGVPNLAEAFWNAQRAK